MVKTYDYKNCQSLFGYAQKVHERSGGICQLCGCGATLAPDSDEYFDLWRQMTVEHLVGKAKKGYLKDLRNAVELHFPEFSSEDLQWVISKIDEANAVTACSLCNSMTSRDSNLKTTKAMTELLSEVHGSPQEVVELVTVHLNKIHDRKKSTVAEKLEPVRKAFREKVQPRLLAHTQRSSEE